VLRLSLRQLHHQLGNGGEADPPSLAAGRKSQPDRGVGLARARRAHRQDHLTPGDVGASSQLADQRRVEAGHMSEREVAEFLELGKAGLGDARSLDIGVALRHLGVEQCGQELQRAVAGLGGLFRVAASLDPGHWQV
jgi:hypothetical protein